uniref:AIG1-type G domain-containing protein n=1 Tax=Scophthalmus maximus TaxID=52904 RepID=A0A8D3EF84_SCOMX
SPGFADMEPDLTIVLIGNSGVGKSASGNTILGQKVFESRLAFNPVTKQITPGTCAPVFGKRISVVDTPGILDTKDTEAEISAYCQELLQSNRPCLVSEADIKLFELLPKLFGTDASKYTMVLFTHGDELRGQSIDQKVKNSRSMSELVSMCGGRYCVFDNNQRGNTQQVRNLLNKVDEMVTESGGTHCTSEMFSYTFIHCRKSRQRQIRVK